MIERLFLTEEAAINILPDGEQIHTFRNSGFMLLGADWDREDIIQEIRKADSREITGKMARGLKHGLCLWNEGCMQSDALFVETNMEKLDALYPPEVEE